MIAPEFYIGILLLLVTYSFSVIYIKDDSGVVSRIKTTDSMKSYEN